MSMIHFDCIGTTNPYAQGSLYVSPSGVASWKASPAPLDDYYAIFAHDGHRPGGVLKYRRRGCAIAEAGCFVWPAFRGRGVALNLWRVLLAAEVPGVIHAHAVTPAGLAMMRACVREFTGMTEWRVLVDGKLVTTDTRCVEARAWI
jgi:GNAT superfamily N-acetyltransferase